MITSTHYMGVPVELIEKLSYLKEEEIAVLVELAVEKVELKELARLQHKYAGTVRCQYYDCGWCYAPDKEETNASSGACLEPRNCQTYKFMSCVDTLK